MPERIDRTRARQRLLGILGHSGPLSTPELSARMGVSERTVRNLVSQFRDDLLVVGRARNTRYHARRTVGGHDVFPVLEVQPDGSTIELDRLRPVGDRGFYGEISGTTWPDVPYYLFDMRPAGFLGRLVPIQHPEYPDDIQLWTGDQTMLYLATHAWNGPGNLIVGDAFSQFLEGAAPPNPLATGEQHHRYPALAMDILQAGVPGSSAGGEQAKFLTTLDGIPLIVKFSPRFDESLGRRIADLMVCEHLAHQVLAAHGMPACRSQIVDAGGQRFLEVERFDRTPQGRRGVVSLLAIDAEHIGVGEGWSPSCEALVEQGHLNSEDLKQAHRLEWFGRLIGNTDMHQGNLSFFRTGFALDGLAPCYDMLPMLYNPQAGHVVEREFVLPIPRLKDAPAFRWAAPVAIDYWQQVAVDPRLSSVFRRIAEGHVALADKIQSIERRLPG